MVIKYFKNNDLFLIKSFILIDGLFYIERYFNNIYRFIKNLCIIITKNIELNKSNYTEIIQITNLYYKSGNIQKTNSKLTYKELK